MSWFNRPPGKEVIVTADGLWRLTEELYGYELMSLSCRRIHLVVIPRSNGTFNVKLSADQVRILLAALPGLSLEREYGTDD